MVLHSILVQAVADTGLSHRQIAKRAGIHHSTVSQLVRGDRMGMIETWDLILQAAGIEIGYRIKKES